MFTGLVTAVGTVSGVEERGDLRVRIASPLDPAALAIGASIACSGVCLTVVERGVDGGEGWFAVDVSAETLARTAASQWQPGRRINLEPALKVGDELGGHIVTGHVDGVGQVAEARPAGGSLALLVVAPASLAPFIATKGSITVDGVSLTVNRVEDQADGRVHVALNIIPHTASVTTLGAVAAGDDVNLEIDVLARYLQRLEALRG
ncbi:riboflavin synthase [Erythrobacteraceae bacterium CFH 75059]|uniref:riboflavin synthase n=1 Tax=Qipengyuania thermophila TaxID=2509361 RepID=UPI00101FDB6B|nr:riboflavin synthase [Qipengyuania thermophila]TCD04077.1 riboflavin synthase [Erythrobacteraceae bacterium CFH 75059]